MTARVRYTLAALVSPGEADTLKPGKVGPEHGDGRAYGSPRHSGSVQGLVLKPLDQGTGLWYIGDFRGAGGGGRVFWVVDLSTRR